MAGMSCGGIDRRNGSIFWGDEWARQRSLLPDVPANGTLVGGVGVSSPSDRADIAVRCSIVTNFPSTDCTYWLRLR
ncbi:hypothetical protein [Phormidium sp. CCY1219]|uniref:hypothetical protein n=1 Tax=Phormidium sp. CCY1219 TaxID=2886104 RepID=UPI002D1F3830|nr:hypothetical protein [Phormidium sp. CCY1219]MEB3828446.1 hypothetical protein [Phormidium sp. CCY1219]